MIKDELEKKASAERMRKSYQTRVAQGLKRVCVWVPESEVERLKKYVNKLNKEAS